MACCDLAFSSRQKNTHKNLGQCCSIQNSQMLTFEKKLKKQKMGENIQKRLHQINCTQKICTTISTSTQNIGKIQNTGCTRQIVHRKSVLLPQKVTEEQEKPKKYPKSETSTQKIFGRKDSKIQNTGCTKQMVHRR